MIASVPLSAIIIVAAAVFAVIDSGNTEGSITRSPDVPRTLSSVSTSFRCLEFCVLQPEF
jgi:hypothetical protein